MITAMAVSQTLNGKAPEVKSTIGYICKVKPWLQKLVHQFGRIISAHT